MKKSLFAILFAHSLLVSSQNDSEYTAFDGSKFKVGDTIQLGLGSGYNQKFISIEQAESNTDIMNYSYSPAIIKKIQRYDKGAYLKIKTPYSFFNYALNIDKAIQLNEIVLSKNDFIQNIKRKNEKRPETFNDSLAFLYFLKVSKDSVKKYTKEYLYLYEKAKFDEIRLDEFEYKKGLKDAQNRIITKYNQIDTSQIRVLYLFFTLSDYNFDNSTFDLLGIDNKKWEGNFQIKSSYSYKGEFSEHKDGLIIDKTAIAIKFTNVSDFNIVKVDENVANSFIKRRKNESGEIDRTVYLQIYFKLKNEYTPPAKQISNSKNNFNDRPKNMWGSESDILYKINAEIKSIKVYDNKLQLYNLLYTK